MASKYSRTTTSKLLSSLLSTAIGVYLTYIATDWFGLSKDKIQLAIPPVTIFSRWLLTISLPLPLFWISYYILKADTFKDKKAISDARKEIDDSILSEAAKKQLYKKVEEREKLRIQKQIDFISDK